MALQVYWVSEKALPPKAWPVSWEIHPLSDTRSLKHCLGQTSSLLVVAKEAEISGLSRALMRTLPSLWISREAPEGGLRLEAPPEDAPAWEAAHAAARETFLANEAHHPRVLSDPSHPGFLDGQALWFHLRLELQRAARKGTHAVLMLGSFEALSPKLEPKLDREMAYAEVESAWQRATRSTDLGFRLLPGGFALIMSSVRDELDGLRVARRFGRLLHEALGSSLALGFAASPLDGVRAEDLFVQAEIARQRALKARFDAEAPQDACGVAIASADLADRVLELEAQAAGFEAAKATDALRFRYRPVIDLESGQAVALEVGLSWPGLGDDSLLEADLARLCPEVLTEIMDQSLTMLPSVGRVAKGLTLWLRAGPLRPRRDLARQLQALHQRLKQPLALRIEPIPQEASELGAELAKAGIPVVYSGLGDVSLGELLRVPPARVCLKASLCRAWLEGAPGELGRLSALAEALNLAWVAEGHFAPKAQAALSALGVAETQGDWCDEEAIRALLSENLPG